MKPISCGVIPFRFIKDSYGNYVKQDTEVLLICSSKNNYNLGIWDFVKGKIEQAETEIECLVRECEEEINLKINTNLLQYCGSQNSKRKLVKLWYYNLNDYPDFKINNEVYKMQFFNIRKLPAISPNQRLFITKIMERFG
jgi:8-oxo-dGTP pyrophosphatase MutT (NUDIX family)